MEHRGIGSRRRPEGTVLRDSAIETVADHRTARSGARPWRGLPRTVLADVNRSRSPRRDADHLPGTASRFTREIRFAVALPRREVTGPGHRVTRLLHRNTGSTLAYSTPDPYRCLSD